MFKSLQYPLIVLTILSAFFALATQAQENINPDIGVIPPGVQLVMDGHNLPKNSVSLFVREVGADTPLLAFNADQAMNPASAVKTITTLTALESLGPAFTWKTELYALGTIADGILQGDLLLKGGGDPFLVEEQLRSMLKALQRTGIEYITGNLVLDGSYFDPSVEQLESLDNQGGRSYNTNPNAVISNFQSVTFYFYPDPNGRNVIIHTDPQLPNLKIDNRLRQVNGACRGYQRGVSFNINPNDSTQVIFEGQFPSGCLQYQMTREVLDAPGYTFGLFQELWQELGGDLLGHLVLGQAPEDLEPILIWASSPMSDVIKSINKFSNNLMTRHLLLTLGAEILGPPATVEKGIEAVASYLELKGLGSDQLQLSNGAGLSRDTRVSTALLGDILQSAYSSPYMPEYITSLPINGLDGTMRNRLRGNNMTGRMHIKTGTLDEVSAVAGYVYSQNNRTFVVAGIMNHELADRGPGVELMDALLTWVYLQ